MVTAHSFRDEKPSCFWFLPAFFPQEIVAGNLPPTGLASFFLIFDSKWFSDCLARFPHLALCINALGQAALAVGLLLLV